jgi:hypothetical protein
MLGRISLATRLRVRQSGRVSDERGVWKFSVIIEATDVEAERVAEAIARSLCPDEDHDGPCEHPWTLIRSRFDDLDDDERNRWQDYFDDERRSADEADELDLPKRNDQ